MVTKPFAIQQRQIEDKALSYFHNYRVYVEAGDGAKGGGKGEREVILPVVWVCVWPRGLWPAGCEMPSF